MPLIADRFTPLRPLSSGLLLVQDQDGTPRVLKRLTAAQAADPDVLHRFKLEAWRVAQLGGGRLVGADPGVQAPDEQPFYTMDFVDGPPATLVPPAELEGMVRQVAEALLALHQKGWVHAALEPLHVRRGEAGAVLVGYANLTPIGQPALQGGNPDYQAPEHAAGAPLDGRADLYGLGALIHYWMTGEPYQGRDLMGDAGGPLPIIARRCLAAEPASRFSDASQVLAALEMTFPAPPPILVPPLLPRTRLMAAVQDLLAALSNGQGTTRRIEGPAGAGKTTFLEAAAETARAAGWPVVQAAGEGPRALPLAPWRRAIAQLTAIADTRHPGLAERFTERLAAFDTRTPARPPSAAEPPELARTRRLAALAEFLQAVAEPGLVIVLDDWDQADEASQAVLVHLRRRLSDQPILWLVAGEAVGLAEAPALALPPLLKEEGLALVNGMLDRPATGPDVEALLTVSMGQPWFLRNLVAHLRAIRAFRREGHFWVLGAPRPGTGELPAPPPGAAPHEWPTTPAALAWQRASQLGHAAWVVGGAAALLAPRITPEMLDRLVPDAEELASGLDALLKADVLRQGPAGYRFAHRAYWTYFADGLAPDRKGQLHATLLAARPDREDRTGGGRELSPEETLFYAWHATQTDAPETLGPLALAAARHLVAHGGLSTARTFLEEGLVTLTPDSPLRGAYLMTLGDLSRLAGDAATARMLYEEAIGGLTGADRLQATLALAETLTQLEAWTEARARYREAAGHATAAGATDALTLALAGLTVSQAALGEHEAALMSGEAAVGAAAEAHPLPRARAMAALGGLLAGGAHERQVEGVALLQRATALFEAEDDKPRLASALLQLGAAESAAGELRFAAESAGRALALARELGDDATAVRAGLMLAAVARELADAPRAAALASEARSRAEALVDPRLAAEAQALEGLSRQAAGEPELGVAMTANALGLLPAESGPEASAKLWLWHAEALLAAGQMPEAVNALLEARGPVMAASRSELIGRRALLLGQWASRTGDRDRARQELKSVLGQPNQHLVAQAALALGRLAMAAGAQAEAAGWLEQARRGATTLGLDPLVAEVALAEKTLADQQNAEPDTPAGAAARVDALMREVAELLPRLTEPATEAGALRGEVGELKALNTLWKALFSAGTAVEAAGAIARAVFALTPAERAFVLGRSLEPLSAQSRTVGDLPFSANLIQPTLCRAAAHERRAVTGEGVLVQPVLSGDGVLAMLFLVGPGLSATPALDEVAAAAAAALSRWSS